MVSRLNGHETMLGNEMKFLSTQEIYDFGVVQP